MSDALIFHSSKYPYASIQAHVVIITGYSGAGKNTVLRAMEDIGFFCVDNLPVALIRTFFMLLIQAKIPDHKIALVIDTRNELRDVHIALDELSSMSRECNIKLQLLFVESSKLILIKRFQETRRSHPLAGERCSLQDAIEQEMNLLKPLKDCADIVIDTDEWHAHHVRAFVREAFAIDEKPQLLVSLISFGFKYGVPSECSVIQDVRFLPNPYFIPELRPLSGLDSAIQEYLFLQESVQTYWSKSIDYLSYIIDQSYKEGRFCLNIGIGCTGGRHRSVALVQRYAAVAFPHVRYTIKHRDINRES